MQVYRQPISVRYIPRILICISIFAITLVSKPVLADPAPALWIQVPQWKDAPWFDANGLKDISKIKKLTVLEELQASSSST